MTEEDSKLRHILGTFFPLYASMSRANQDCIEEALLPTLRDAIQLNLICYLEMRLNMALELS